MKLSCHDRLERVWSVMKTREDNDLTDHLSVFYSENDIELMLLIRSSADSNENQMDNYMIDHKDVVCAKNKTKFLWLI